MTRANGTSSVTVRSVTAATTWTMEWVGVFLSDAGVLPYRRLRPVDEVPVPEVAHGGEQKLDRLQQRFRHDTSLTSTRSG